MNDAELLLIQLKSLRDQLAGAVGTIDAILGVAVRSATPEEGTCDHPIPLRRPMPSMGHHTRFYCGGCQTMVEE